MTETGKTKSGAAMSAQKEIDPFSLYQLNEAAEKWQRVKRRGRMRFVHVNGPYIQGAKEHPGEVLARDMSLKRKIVLEIEGANVQEVHGLPKGWTWEIVDHDLLDEEPYETAVEHGFKRHASIPTAEPREKPKGA